MHLTLFQDWPVPTFSARKHNYALPGAEFLPHATCSLEIFRHSHVIDSRIP